MRLLRGLTLASAIGAWFVIIAGGFTTATGSGPGCKDILACGEAPLGPQAAVIEIAHRLVAWTEGFLVLILLVLVMWRYRTWREVRNLTLLAFVLIVAQSSLGMLSVAVLYGAFGAASYYPVLVTAHLGLAAAFLAVTVLNASVVFRGGPPAPASSPFPTSGEATDSG